MVDITLGLGIGMLNVIFIILGLAAIIIINKTNRKFSNPFGNPILFLIIINVGLTFIRILELSYLYLNPNTQPLTFGTNLTLNHMIPLIIGISGLILIMYIYDFKKIITLPIVICYYLFLMLYQFESIISLMVFILIVYLVNFFILFKIGFEKHNGIIFTLGLYYLIIFLFELVSYVFLEDIFILYGAVLSLSILNLGAWGIINKYLFKDYEKMRRIKETWVSTIINVSKNIYITQIKAKMLRLECPICKSQKVKEFPPEKVEDRQKNSKGIVQLLIQKDEICEHPFVVYIDRSFSIRGYSTLDYSI